MRLMPANAASITAAKPVVHGAVPHRIECCCTFKTRLLLFEQHPHFVQRRSHASGYRRPCSSRVWSASRVGVLPPFFRVVCRLCRSWKCWCSTLHIDRCLDFVFSSIFCYVTRIRRLYSHPLFPRKPRVSLFVVFRFCF